MSYFDNNPFMKLFDELSEETQEEYKKKGIDMYETTNFETGEMYTPLMEMMSIESILSCIKSGIKESDLTREELEILNNYRKKNN